MDSSYYFLITLLLQFTNIQKLTDAAAAAIIDSSNINSTMVRNDFIILHFYVRWCPFSQNFAPIYEEAADYLQKRYPEPGLVLLGTVDCEKETELVKRFRISKYPTLKIIRNGEMSKQEYRGPRTVKALKEFVVEELREHINEMKTLKDFLELNKQRRNVIAYLESPNVTAYKIYRKVARNFREFCDFYIIYETALANQTNIAEIPTIIFKPDIALAHGIDEIYGGSVENFEQLNIWTHEKCVPLVREITFQNAEELTEMGLPMLILFYGPNDLLAVRDFKAIVKERLSDEQANLNFITAKAELFTHPLMHLGKTMQELPVLAIDSLNHMYLFSNFKNIYVPGALKQFILDLYSGKLHKEHHERPLRPKTIEEKFGVQQYKTESGPPASVFRKLSPSQRRYTLLRKDEL